MYRSGMSPDMPFSGNSTVRCQTLFDVYKIDPSGQSRIFVSFPVCTLVTITLRYRMALNERNVLTTLKKYVQSTLFYIPLGMFTYRRKVVCRCSQVAKIYLALEIYTRR